MAKMTQAVNVRLFSKKSLDAALEPVATVTIDCAESVAPTLQQVDALKQKLGLGMCRLFGADFYVASNFRKGGPQTGEENR